MEKELQIAHAIQKVPTMRARRIRSDPPFRIDSGIYQLASDPSLCRQLTRAARQKVETDFDLEQNARRLAKCFVGENAEC